MRRGWLLAAVALVARPAAATDPQTAPAVAASAPASGDGPVASPRPYDDAPAPPQEPEIELPPAPARFADEQALADWLDLALERGWAAKGLAPAPRVDDATWLRRLSLDLRGEIAAADEIERFVADAAPDKHARQIGEWLADRRFATQMASRWTKLLLVAAGMNSTRLVPYLRPWLDQQFAAHRPMAGIVRELLTSSMRGAEPGGASLMLAYFDSVESLTSITARSFLGLQIQCAQCHDHPFDSWKQDDFNRLASFFTEHRADFSALPEEEQTRTLDMVKEQRKQKAQAERMAGGKRGAMRDGAGGAMGGSMAGGGSPMSGASVEESYDELDESVLVCGFVVEDIVPEAVVGTKLRRLLMKAASQGERRREEGMARGEAPDVHRPDTEEVRELSRLFSTAGRGGVQGRRQLLKERAHIDELVGRVSPDARELVEKYFDQRESFAVAGFPDGTPYVPREGVSRREALADWIVAPGNPWFGRSMANRVVQQLLGKGFVEPVDDLSGSIDRVLPGALDVLGKAFLDHGSDLRFLFGAVARTRAYAVGAAATRDAFQASTAERWYAAHPARPLTLDQFARSLLKTVDPAFPAPDGDEAAARDGKRVRELVKVLAKSCNAPDGTGLVWWSASIPQALFAMNGPFGAAPQDATALPGFAEFADLSRAPDERLAPLWLRTIGRAPAPREARSLLEQLPQEPEALADAFAELRWALLNSTEFQVNH